MPPRSRLPGRCLRLPGGCLRLPGGWLGLLLCASLVGLGGSAAPVSGAGGPARVHSSSGAGQKEYQVKGAFLFKFIAYTTWPASAFASERSPIEVVLIGEEERFEDVVVVLEGREHGGRRLRVRRVERVEDVGEAHVVFAVGVDAPTERALIQAYAKRPTLLIGDDDPFAERGGAVNFYLDKGRVRFAVNTSAVESTSLKVSSQLLKLARIVKRRPL